MHNIYSYKGIVVLISIVQYCRTNIGRCEC